MLAATMQQQAWSDGGAECSSGPAMDVLKPALRTLRILRGARAQAGEGEFGTDLAA